MNRKKLQSEKEGIKSEKGVTLIEVIISIAVLGILATGYFTALNGSTTSLIFADQRATGESLARSQWEYVKSQPYDASFNYGIVTPPDANYSIQMASDNQTIRTGMQEMTYEVFFKGHLIVSLTDYKLYNLNQ